MVIDLGFGDGQPGKKENQIRLGVVLAETLIWTSPLTSRDVCSQRPVIVPIRFASLRYVYLEQ
jgi:hypothetical protein